MPAQPIEARPANGRYANILIVDDSVVARAVIGRAIDGHAAFGVGGAVQDVKAALAFLKTARVDAIVLDLELPGVDGLTALPELLAAGRGAKVLVVSSACAEGATKTVQALALGAADTLVKPGIGAFGGRFAESLIGKLTQMLDVAGAVAPPIAPKTGTSGFDIVAIGASTGGIHALSQVLREIPTSFPLPILITQHLPESFMPYFAAQVAVLARRPCDVATDRMRLRPGRVVIAPGDAHLRVVSLGDGNASIRLTREASRSGCMPSVDPMFESVAEVFGARALAVVLSGMGRDGSDGARHIVRHGGSVVVQDRASSVVWGMPGAIAAGGEASAILPPDEIGLLIATRRRPA